MADTPSVTNRADAERVPQRILASLIASLSAGVVPRSGAPYIAIGRKEEIAAFLSDLESIDAGGGTMRFLIGRYGSGKSFLIQLVRGYALERNFVTADADLSPERRLYGSRGAGVATYRELMKNLASKSSPDGGALPKILARWINGIQESAAEGGEDVSSVGFRLSLQRRINDEMRDMEFLVGGFDFSHVMSHYFQAYLAGDESGDATMSACLRWLRGEFTTKTEAKNELGFSVSTIIDDENWYDFLKLWASLFKKIGYRGFMVFIDECVNLYKIPHKTTRENNYEKILSMFNDTLQGRAAGLGIVFGGTPLFLEDARRGLFSYEALRSRLCDSRFASSEFVNLIGPVIRLRTLSENELLALIKRVGDLYATYYHIRLPISEEQQIRFLNICLSRAGADSMVTPREMIRDYMAVLNILTQNRNATFESVVGEIAASSQKNAAQEDAVDTDEKTEGKEEKKPFGASNHKAYTADDIEF